MSASELSNVVMFQDGAGPETVIVAGVVFGIDYIKSLDNSKPDFFNTPQNHRGALSRRICRRFAGPRR